MPRIPNGRPRGFQPAPADELRIVTPDESVCPTRVVWRAPAGRYASRIFPTEARAWNYVAAFDAARVLVCVQAVTEAPPVCPKRLRVGRAFRTSRTADVV